MSLVLLISLCSSRCFISLYLSNSESSSKSLSSIRLINSFDWISFSFNHVVCGLPVEVLRVRIENEDGLKQLAYEIDNENMTEVLAGLRYRFGPPVGTSVDVEGGSPQQQWIWHTGEDVIVAVKSEHRPFVLSYRPSLLDPSEMRMPVKTKYICEFKNMITLKELSETYTSEELTLVRKGNRLSIMPINKSIALELLKKLKKK